MVEALEDRFWVRLTLPRLSQVLGTSLTLEKSVQVRYV